MEITITGEGELVIRYIDKAGRTLMQERLFVSGSPKTETLRVVELALRTQAGEAAVAPVLVSRSNAAQKIAFDGEPPSRFTRRRCKEIGCSADLGAEASRGVAPLPDAGQGPALRSDDPAMERLVKRAAAS